MRKLGKMLTATKETVQAYTYCMCTGCGCYCNCWGDASLSSSMFNSTKYSSSDASYSSRIN